MRHPLPLLLGVSALVGLCLSLPGCSGCREDPLAERKEKREEEKPSQEDKPKEDFLIEPLVTVPGDTEFAFPFSKPGHWVSARHDITANHFDVQAELLTASTNSLGEPFAIENTPFQLYSSRPAPLPKGQIKRFETTYFIPREAAIPTAGVWLYRDLRPARGGRSFAQDPYRIACMPAYQYYFVVLADNPDQYGYLKRLTSVAAPMSGDLGADTLLYYRVVLQAIDPIVPLPSHALTWTSIAYVLWDDADSAALTPAQQQALLDWLHWGGQLIISGPHSLEKLRGGFLDDFLPADAEQTLEIAPAAVEELNRHWSLTDVATGRLLTLDPLPGRPLVGVELAKREDADWLPGCGSLVAERRVGAGRIVVTAFSLTDGLLVNWGSYDSFFNACLLRRPSRKFEKYEFAAGLSWAEYDSVLANDARLLTTLRYFTRDIGHLVAGSARQAEEPGEAPLEASADGSPDDGRSSVARAPDPEGNSLHFNGYPLRLRYGMAAWNDFSGASDAARQSLKDAAGISIPRGQFVLQVLAVYLLVLAPLNWGFFRMLGRVEWAWVAAPVIAVAAALAVVRLAQLDIGFARSLTEIGIAEVQAGYTRAHVTRYSALYTSLSTSYDVLFDEQGALAQPFARETGYVRGPNESISAVTLHHDRQLSLRGFKVPSNKTDILHSEYMRDLGGTFDVEGNDSNGFLVKNQTSISLKGVGVLRGAEQGGMETAWVGDLHAGDSARLLFRPAEGGTAHLPQWDESPATLSYEVQANRLLSRMDTDGDGQLARAEVRGTVRTAAEFFRLDRNTDGMWDRQELISWCRRSRAGEVCLGQLIALASRALGLGPGEMRLIGWTEDEMPGMTIGPASAQALRRTLFLVHLRRPSLPPPRRDWNRKADVISESPEDTQSDAMGTEP